MTMVVVCVLKLNYLKGPPSDANDNCKDTGWGKDKKGERDDICFFIIDSKNNVIAIFVMLLSYIAICCFKSVTETPFLNYLTLIIFNSAVTWVVTYASIRKSFIVVFMAGCLTTSLCMGLIMYTMKSDDDPQPEAQDKAKAETPEVEEK